MKIIKGFFGKDGIMSEGWSTKKEAQEEFDSFYQDDEYNGCEIIYYNGFYVIAYYEY